MNDVINCTYLFRMKQFFFSETYQNGYSLLSPARKGERKSQLMLSNLNSASRQNSAHFAIISSIARVFSIFTWYSMRHNGVSISNVETEKERSKTNEEKKTDSIEMLFNTFGKLIQWNGYYCRFFHFHILGRRKMRTITYWLPCIQNKCNGYFEWFGVAVVLFLHRAFLWSTIGAMAWEMIALRLRIALCTHNATTAAATPNKPLKRAKEVTIVLLMPICILNVKCNTPQSEWKHMTAKATAIKAEEIEQHTHTHIDQHLIRHANDPSENKCSAKNTALQQLQLQRGNRNWNWGKKEI